MQTIAAKFSLLEEADRETAFLCKKVDCQLPKPHVISDYLQRLLQTRRELTMEGIFSATGNSEVAKLSKQIQREFRKSIRKKHKTSIAEKSNQFKDLRSIAGIWSNGKRQLMASILDENGQLRHDQKEIMDVFSDFYVKLYQTSLSECDNEDWGEDVHIVPNVSVEEVTLVLRKRAKKKAADERGIVAEML